MLSSDEIEQQAKMISSHEIEQQAKMISSAKKDLNFKKLRMKRVFFLTLMIVLLLVVTIGVLIFYPRVVENNHNSDNEDIKQIIKSKSNLFCFLSFCH